MEKATGESFASYHPEKQPTKDDDDDDEDAHDDEDDWAGGAWAKPPLTLANLFNRARYRSRSLIVVSEEEPEKTSTSTRTSTIGRAESHSTFCED